MSTCSRSFAQRVPRVPLMGIGLWLLVWGLWLGQPAVAEDAPRLNINTASAQALADTLAGVGEVTATRIVAYREAHGPFLQVEDLVLVQGIGQRLLDRNRHRLSVEEDVSTPSADDAVGKLVHTEQ